MVAKLQSWQSGRAGQAAELAIAAAAKLQSRQQYVKNSDPAHSEACNGQH